MRSSRQGRLLGSVSRFHLDSDLFVTKMTSLSPTSLAQTHSEKKIALLIFSVHAHKNNLIRLCKVLSTINVERRASKIGKGVFWSILMSRVQVSGG